MSTTNKRTRSESASTDDPVVFVPWQNKVEKHAQSTENEVSATIVNINDVNQYDMLHLLTSFKLKSTTNLINYFTSKFNITNIETTPILFKSTLYKEKRKFITDTAFKSLAIASIRANVNWIKEKIYGLLYVRIVDRKDTLDYITHLLPVMYRCVKSKAFDDIIVPLHIEELNVAIVMQGTSVEHIETLKNTHGVEYIIEYKDDDPDVLIHRLFEIARK
jgi:hypothetical protein